MELKQKYYLTNYDRPEELTVRIVDAIHHLRERRKNLLLIEMPKVIQKWFHPVKVERLFDIPVVDGEETCIVYTPIDITFEEGGENLESKES